MNKYKIKCHVVGLSATALSHQHTMLIYPVVTSLDISYILFLFRGTCGKFKKKMDSVGCIYIHIQLNIQMYVTIKEEVMNLRGDKGRIAGGKGGVKLHKYSLMYEILKNNYLKVLKG